MAQQSVALVGLGSFAFHATLLYEAQLADELPMILSASYCCFVLFDTSPGFDQRRARGSIILVLFNILFTYS
jgi:dihydroceramidase